ncbi:hypothetical protein HHK36_009859 [Tetracentron sinense]|uniref:Cyclase n=1 Tax=Tetracentron sinense TaxID=13715 RepID=A0A834ZBL6_TETSI|nr:hypothetical protein HHK36_009859 [Tetracentron sinense]
MENGSLANNSEMKMPVHTGTHVDAPGHVFDHYFDAGFDVDTLDLGVLNGPALLVDVPRDKNITVYLVLANRWNGLRVINSVSVSFESGVCLIDTITLVFLQSKMHLKDPVIGVNLNPSKSWHCLKLMLLPPFQGESDVSKLQRRLMWKKEFDTSYVGFMKDGARWLVEYTDIKFVGVDCLSAAAFEDAIPSHLVFLEGREVILVEGLKLDDIQPGIYSVHCLPLRLLGAEGSPIRCILIK